MLLCQRGTEDAHRTGRAQRIRTADPNGPKGYIIPCEITLTVKAEVMKKEEGLIKRCHFSSQESIMHNESCFLRSF